MRPIQLYSLATPNGQKIGVALEEMALPYEPHVINILAGDQFKDDFVKLNPNSKIPAIYDPETDLKIMESAAILIYLAEKSGKFLSRDPIEKNQTLQWLFFQVGHIGPMFGQFGHFYAHAKEKCDHPYPLERYSTESKRLLTVLDQQLKGRDYIMGDHYTIADMAIFPWVLCLDRFYKATETLKLNSYTQVNRWLQALLERPQVQKGLTVCPFPES